MPDRRRYLWFRLVFLVMQMPVGITLPYFYLHLRYGVGLSPRDISFITMISGVAIVLTQQLWGYVADVRISKRTLILFNSLASGAAFVVVGQLKSLPALVAVMFVFQILNTPIIQLLHGFLFQHEGSEHRFGLLRAYGSLGFVIVNVLTGLAADLLFPGNRGFIFPVFGLLTVAGAAMLFLLPDHPTAAHPSSRRPTFLEVQRFFLSRPEVSWFLAVLFFYQAAHSLSYAFQGLLMTELGAENTLVGLSYSWAALLEIPVFFAANRLIGRFGELRIIVFGCLVQAARWVLVWAATSPGQIIATSTLHCITFATFYASAVSYMNRFAGPHYKASAQTLLGLLYFGLANLFGNLAGGQVVGSGAVSRGVAWVVREVLHLPDRGPLRNLYLFSSALALVAFVLAVGLVIRNPGGQAARRDHPPPG